MPLPMKIIKLLVADMGNTLPNDQANQDDAESLGDEVRILKRLLKKKLTRVLHFRTANGMISLTKLHSLLAKTLTTCQVRLLQICAGYVDGINGTLLMIMQIC